MGWAQWGQGRHSRSGGSGLVEAQVNVGPAFDRIPNFVGAEVRPAMTDRLSGVVLLPTDGSPAGPPVDLSIRRTHR